MNFDFYTVQLNVDGFGNDTYVESIWKTEEEARRHAEENFKKSSSYKQYFEIIGGYFGKKLELAFN